MKTKIALIFSNIILLSLLLVSWNNKVNNANVNTEVHIITSETAKVLINEYPKNLRDTSDSKCAWYSIKELDAFLTIIKNQYKTRFNDDALYDKMGIRIYYGRYPNKVDRVRNTEINDLNRDYSKKHCLFLVPTRDEYTKETKSTIADTIHRDFFISKGSIALVGSERNHGQLAPPEKFEGSYFFQD